jgi:hypothetical protein
VEDKMRRISRVDKNQAEIVQALRQIGAHVLLLHQHGSGCPDLLVGYRDNLWLMEVKVRGGKLTMDEESFYNEWRPYMVVIHSPEEALQAIGAI